MNYPKEIMSRKELIKQGYPPEFLRRVWNTPGQQVAFLLNPANKHSAIMYRTSELEKFIQKEMRAAERARKLQTGAI